MVVAGSVGAARPTGDDEPVAFGDIKRASQATCACYIGGAGRRMSTGIEQLGTGWGGKVKNENLNALAARLQVDGILDDVADAKHTKGES